MIDTDIAPLFADFQGPASPSASVAIVHSGEVVLAKSFGYANVEEGIAADRNTNYRLASVSKQFTATTIAQLIRDGALSLEDAASRYLEMPAWAEHVTARHLIAHTSGLPDYEALIPLTQHTQLSDADVLSLLDHADSLDFEPGSTFHYSNTGYALLALIVEAVSRQRFADVLRDRIFDPLGMNGTVAHVEGISVVANRAYGYSAAGGKFVRTDQSITSAVLGDGGIYSSINDLVTWVRALSAPEWQRSFTVQPSPGPDSSTKYDFGWYLDAFDGRRRERHEGDTVGFQNTIQRFPDQDITIIVLTNRGDATPRAIAEEIARRFPV